MKRKCFEHEKELRATILLPEAQWQVRDVNRGILIKCDLDVLITQVYVSPESDKYVFDTVKALCAGEAHILNKPIQQSQLLKHAGYDISTSRSDLLAE